MSEEQQTGLCADAWASLRSFTAARIAIGRTGTSIPLQQVLEFKLAHAHARDAVYSKLDIDALRDGLAQFDLPIHQLHSHALNREKYLTRPDYGRRLDEASAEQLQNQIPVCIAIVITDGPIRNSHKSIRSKLAASAYSKTNSSKHWYDEHYYS